MSNNNRLLEVEDLKVYFPFTKGTLIQKKIGDVKAVDGINFHVNRGETLGLVGESGCGKTTISRALLGLEKISGGRIIFEGQNVSHLEGDELQNFRRKVQMIFQDPFSCLNPRMTVREIIGEPIIIHKLLASKAEYNEKIAELMSIVGLNPNMANRYPHEFSGGQRQRIGIARALSVNPELIICDEPVSALDVSIQAQIINLLEDLQEMFNLTYLFIAHDLAVVRHISDRVAVMYLGNIVEIAHSHDLYQKPINPYTKALISAAPVPDPEVEAKREHVQLEGEIPSPFNPPTGCKFHPRCVEAKYPICRDMVPKLQQYNGADHLVACHFDET